MKGMSIETLIYIAVAFFVLIGAVVIFKSGFVKSTASHIAAMMQSAMGGAV